MSNQIYGKKIAEYFYQVNRTLTILLVSILAVAGLVLWLTGVSLQNISTWVGVVLMVFAVLFYRLPGFSYQLTRKHFSNQQGASTEILDSGWDYFRKWLETQNPK
jgi:membrane protein YdbS with pleckstrin-like domain